MNQRKGNRIRSGTMCGSLFFSKWQAKTIAKLIEHENDDSFPPVIQENELLRRDCENFLECIRIGKNPKKDGCNGLREVSVLEAATKSIRKVV